MKAIILAAGVGKRFRSVNEYPKCLLNINGKVLIQRYLEAFAGLNIRDIRIVIGYKKGKIEEFVRKVSFDGGIEFVENKEYEKGNVLSLWKGIRDVEGDVLVMDGDVYFEREVLKKLVESPFKNCLLIDMTSENMGEEVMVGISDDKIMAMGRGLKGDFDLIGEGVGFIKISGSGVEILKEIVKDVIAKQDYKDYEEVLPKLFEQMEFKYELVDGFKWIEIDFKKDFEQAVVMDRVNART